LNASPSSTPPDRFSPGFGNAFWFSVFNAFSFQIILSSPMILYAKSLNASATALGILVGMMPLLVIFQIPAAAYVPRVGYKRFVYGGWNTRVAVIFALALVPITSSFLKPPSQLALILALSFFFNLSRGISSCAWLPWMTSLIPSQLRGRYLARDSACMNAASSLTFLIAGFLLGNHPTSWRFAAIFAFSALAGYVSLKFLKRIPDAPVAADPAASSPQPVPWLELAAYPPFRKLLRMNIAWSFAAGGQVAFTTAYLRGLGGLPEGTILIISSLYFLGGLLSLTIGRQLDRFGSKPALTTAALIWIVATIAWTLIASEFLPMKMSSILLLQFLMGFAMSTFNTSNVRLAMVTSPAMGRTHFFALFSVVANVTLGLAPILWGLIIDSFGQLNYRWQNLTINRYSIFYFGCFLLFTLTVILMRRLEEPAAFRVQELVREVLINSPQRFWTRLLNRT
jgi:MFS family permease